MGKRKEKLSKDNSKKQEEEDNNRSLYDLVKNSDDPQDQYIARFIERLNQLPPLSNSLFKAENIFANNQVKEKKKKD
jgi:hypothetical protein